MSRKQKSFGDCKAEGSVWITLTTGEYHPDILVSACGLYKPVLGMFIAASSNPGDLVLDAFCGSGTTMQAAYNLDRAWIGIDCAEEAICSVLKRLNIGSEKMGDFVSGKTARTYKPHELLDEGNFAQSLFGTCSFQFWVSDANLEQVKKDFKVKVAEPQKHSALSELAKAVDPAIKAASLAVLAKMIS